MVPIAFSLVLVDIIEWDNYIWAVNTFDYIFFPALLVYAVLNTVWVWLARGVTRCSFYLKIACTAMILICFLIYKPVGEAVSSQQNCSYALGPDNYLTLGECLLNNASLQFCRELSLDTPNFGAGIGSGEPFNASDLSQTLLLFNYVDCRGMNQMRSIFQGLCAIFAMMYFATIYLDVDSPSGLGPAMNRQRSFQSSGRGMGRSDGDSARGRQGRSRLGGLWGMGRTRRGHRRQRSGMSSGEVRQYHRHVLMMGRVGKTMQRRWVES